MSLPGRHISAGQQRMPDLRRAPWEVVVASKNLESCTIPGAGGNSQPPAHRVLALARALTKRSRRKDFSSLAHILRHVHPADQGDLLFVAEYLDRPDVRSCVPPKILNRFENYAMQIPNLRSFLQRGAGPALTCDRQQISPASTFDESRWKAILASTYLVLAAAAAGNPLPYHPQAVLSLACLLAGLDYRSGILHGVPLPHRTYLSTTAQFLSRYQLDDHRFPHTILHRLAVYAASVPALASKLKGGELSGDSALAWADDGGRELPVDDAVSSRRRRSKGKQVSDDLALSTCPPKPDLKGGELPGDSALACAEDGGRELPVDDAVSSRRRSKGKQVSDDLALSACPPKPDNVEQSRDAASVLLPQAQLNRAGNDHDEMLDYSWAASQSRPGSSSPPTSLFSHEMYHRPMSSADNDRITRHHPSTEDSIGTPRTGESTKNAGFVSVNMRPYMEQNREEMIPDNSDVQSLERNTRGGAVDENQHAFRDVGNLISATAAAMGIQPGPGENGPVPVLSTYLLKACFGFCIAMVFIFGNTPLSTKKRLMIGGFLLTALAQHVATGVLSSFGII